MSENNNNNWVNVLKTKGEVNVDGVNISKKNGKYLFDMRELTKNLDAKEKVEFIKMTLENYPGATVKIEK